MGTDEPSPVEKMKRWPQTDWTWSEPHSSPDVTLSGNRLTASFHTSPLLESTSVAGVRGLRGFRDGEHYWEVKFSQPPNGVSVIVGVCTERAELHSTNTVRDANLIGSNEHSWGLSYKGYLWHNGQKVPFCEAFYCADTVIGLHLNLYEGTLTVYKDGQRLGIAARGLHLLNQQIFPAASSTAVDTELELGMKTCRHLSLQEKCYVSIARRLNKKSDVELLPLPCLMKRHLESMT